MSTEPIALATASLGRVECGMASGKDWWCMLRPAHSGGCVPRRDTSAASAGPVRPGEEPTT